MQLKIITMLRPDKRIFTETVYPSLGSYFASELSDVFGLITWHLRRKSCCIHKPNLTCFTIR